MIQYPYQRSQTLARPGRSSTTISRPVATFRVIGPAGSREITALVDTGADATLLPRMFAELIGIPLNGDDQDTIVGIDGGSLTIWYAKVNIELITPGGSPRWSARVGFYRGARPILGHAGFLDHFTARFNGRAKTLTLTPNGTASGPA